MFQYPRFQNFADSLLNILTPAPTPSQRAEVSDLIHAFEARSWNPTLFEQAVREIGEPFEVTVTGAKAGKQTVKAVVQRYLELNPVVLGEEEDNL